MSKAPKCRFCGAGEENHNERGCWPERQVRQSRTPEWRVEEVVPKEVREIEAPVDKSQELDKSQEPTNKSHTPGRPKKTCGLPDHDERGSRYCKHCREAKKKAV